LSRHSRAIFLPRATAFSRRPRPAVATVVAARKISFFGPRGEAELARERVLVKSACAQARNLRNPTKWVAFSSRSASVNWQFVGATATRLTGLCC